MVANIVRRMREGPIDADGVWQDVTAEYREDVRSSQDVDVFLRRSVVGENTFGSGKHQVYIDRTSLNNLSGEDAWKEANRYISEYEDGNHGLEDLPATFENRTGDDTDTLRINGNVDHPIGPFYDWNWSYDIRFRY